MSAWDSYIQNMKASGLQICGIYGLQGGAWAQSPGVNLTNDEILNIVRGINSQSFEKGLTLGNQKYRIISMTKDSLTAKAGAEAKDDEKHLVHIALGKQCFCLGGICGPDERSATFKVESIRDHLAKSGF